MTTERDPGTRLPPDPDRHLAALFDGMSRFLLVVGFFGVILTIPRAVRFGLWGSALAQGLIFLTYFFLTILRPKRTRLKSRVWPVVGMLWLFGFSGLLTFGLLGQGLILMVCAIILAGFGVGRAGAVVVSAGTILACGGVGFGVVSGLVRLRIDANAYLVTPAAWFIALAAILFVAVVVDRLGHLVASWRESFERLRESKAELEREITDRQQAEAQLRESKDLLNTILDNVGAAIFIKDTRYRYTYVNQKVCEIFGKSPGEILGKGDDAFFSAASVGEIMLSDQPVIEGGETVSREEVALTSAGGTPRTYWVVKLPLRDGAGKVTGLCGISTEITERKVAETERERLIGELEIRNAELERFTYTVSHDLKSPLITIRGFLGFLEQAAHSGDTARVRADVERIRQATDKMGRLLRELLELSRVGREVRPPEPVALADVVREALEAVEGQLRARGVVVEVAPGLPVVLGDRMRLVEVVQNLIDNAVKCMGDQARPRIEIGVRGVDADGTPVVFVRDNGVGIDPRYTERVFALFEKLDPKSEGTGIGLALARRIVEVHGGRIWAESAGEFRGAAFCFTLPVARQGKGA